MVRCRLRAPRLLLSILAVLPGLLASVPALAVAALGGAPSVLVVGRLTLWLVLGELNRSAGGRLRGTDLAESSRGCDLG
jgi:hypothetical protein